MGVRRGSRVRRSLAIAAVLAAGVVSLTLAWLSNPPRLTDAEIRDGLAAGFAPDPAKGEALFHLGGCADCHRSAGTGSAVAGGAPLETFAGTFYPSNISPDLETGIGRWSDADFVNAMARGVSPEGRHYYPAFPYTAYAQSTREDLLHLKSYLDGLDPVRSANLDHDLGFPFNFRIANGLWKLAFHRASQFEPDPERSEAWNRGAYIVNALGHCGTCHTPRNLLFAERRSEAFTGAAPTSDGARAAPRIAGLETQKVLNGLDEWAASVHEDSAMFLVTKTFSEHVPYEDHLAVAEYLSSLQR